VGEQRRFYWLKSEDGERVFEYPSGSRGPGAGRGPAKASNIPLDAVYWIWKGAPMTTVRATVEIFGQRLGLRADGDSARLEELARFVDTRMREVAERSSSVDTVKIAVLTALNIADELFHERETDQDVRQERLEEQAERLVTKLEQAMRSGEARE
jgi:cell division protein ZapA